MKIIEHEHQSDLAVKSFLGGSTEGEKKRVESVDVMQSGENLPA